MSSINIDVARPTGIYFIIKGYIPAMDLCLPLGKSAPL